MEVCSTGLAGPDSGDTYLFREIGTCPPNPEREMWATSARAARTAVYFAATTAPMFIVPQVAVYGGIYRMFATYDGTTAALEAGKFAACFIPIFGNFIDVADGVSGLIFGARMLSGVKMERWEACLSIAAGAVGLCLDLASRGAYSRSGEGSLIRGVFREWLKLANPIEAARNVGRLAKLYASVLSGTSGLRGTGWAGSMLDARPRLVRLGMAGSRRTRTHKVRTGRRTRTLVSAGMGMPVEFRRDTLPQLKRAVVEGRSRTGEFRAQAAASTGRDLNLELDRRATRLHPVPPDAVETLAPHLSRIPGPSDPFDYNAELVRLLGKERKWGGSFWSGGYVDVGLEAGAKLNDGQFAHLMSQRLGNLTAAMDGHVQFARQSHVGDGNPLSALYVSDGEIGANPEYFEHMVDILTMADAARRCGPDFVGAPLQYTYPSLGPLSEKLHDAIEMLIEIVDAVPPNFKRIG